MGVTKLVLYPAESNTISFEVQTCSSISEQVFTQSAYHLHSSQWSPTQILQGTSETQILSLQTNLSSLNKEVQNFLLGFHDQKSNPILKAVLETTLETGTKFAVTLQDVIISSVSVSDTQDRSDDLAYTIEITFRIISEISLGSHRSGSSLPFSHLTRVPLDKQLHLTWMGPDKAKRLELNPVFFKSLPTTSSMRTDIEMKPSGDLEWPQFSKTPISTTIDFEFLLTQNNSSQFDIVSFIESLCHSLIYAPEVDQAPNNKIGTAPYDVSKTINSQNLILNKTLGVPKEIAPDHKFVHFPDARTNAEGVQLYPVICKLSLPGIGHGLYGVISKVSTQLHSTYSDKTQSPRLMSVRMSLLEVTELIHDAEVK